MNLPTLLFFGILGTVCAIFKIPEHDACVLKVLLCDDFTKPLTPGDNSTLEMFESVDQLNAVCDELSKFRNCLKNAETFCKENANLDLGFELLNNRRLAFDLCEHGSDHQQVYMSVEGCVNKYSHSAIEFCTDRAVETVGLNFRDGDFESECKYLGTIQHCHLAVVTDQCGSIAGNMLEKLVVFRGERDFMCIGYEEDNRKNSEAFYATMDSYVQQYRNTVYQTETSTSPKSSYRPYDLYRPHVDETLENEHNKISSEDLGIKDAEESSCNPNVLSFEDATKNSYTGHMHAEELCRILPGNISKLVKKLGRYSRVNDMNIADPLDIVESKRSEKFSISKMGKDIPLGNKIWKAEEPENIATDNKQNQYEEIYVVTPSTVIETFSEPIRTVSKDEDMLNLDEDSQSFNKDDDDQYFVEVPQECNSKDSKLEKDFIAKSMNFESSREGFLELNSNDQNDKHPIPDKFIDASTNHEVAPEEEQFSPESEIFSKRSGRKYATDVEVKIKLFDIFEVRVKVKSNGNLMKPKRSFIKTRIFKRNTNRKK